MRGSARRRPGLRSDAANDRGQTTVVMIQNTAWDLAPFWIMTTVVCPLSWSALRFLLDRRGLDGDADLVAQARDGRIDLLAGDRLLQLRLERLALRLVDLLRLDHLGHLHDRVAGRCLRAGVPGELA